MLAFTALYKLSILHYVTLHYKHVDLLSRACYYQIRSLRHIRKYPTDDFTKTIACAIVSSWLDSANAVLVECQRPTLGSYSESRILWRSSLLINTATPVHRNLSQPSTGSQLSGESTSSSPPSPTDFFQPVNRPKWPLGQKASSLCMPLIAYSCQAIQTYSTFSHQPSNWRACFQFRSSIRLESTTSRHQRLYVNWTITQQTKNKLLPSHL